MSFFFNAMQEFRPLVLYIPAVLIYGITANWYTPILQVIWDSVFYKSMAYGLHHITSFQLRNHFPIPPLYPLILSIGFFAPNYRWVVFIQSWINPALYFLTLFPLYRFSRFLLSPRDSAGVCLLFLLYPSTIFTQWSMSENLAAPLTLWSAVVSTRLLLAESPSLKDGFLLGIAVTALMLTRVQLIVLGLGFLIWLMIRTIRTDRNPGAVCLACSVPFTLVLMIWWGMGYLNHPTSSPVYAELPPWEWGSVFSLYFPLFYGLWTALWLEGAVTIPVILVTRLLNSFIQPALLSKSQRELTRMVFFVSLLLVASVAGFMMVRVKLNPGWINLRYIFYANLLCLPIALDGLKQDFKSRNSTIDFVILYGLVCLLFTVGFFIPEAWTRLTDPHKSYVDAPALDFIYQIKKTPIKTSLFFLSLSWVIGLSWIKNRRLGWALVCVGLLYIQLSAFDYLFKIQRRTIQNLWVNDIHAFCAQWETGHWKNVPIYCEEEERMMYLRPNIIYWLNQSALILPPDAPRPTPPYLLLTPHSHADGIMQFRSGELRAYLYNSAEIHPATESE